MRIPFSLHSVIIVFMSLARINQSSLFVPVFQHIILIGIVRFSVVIPNVLIITTVPFP